MKCIPKMAAASFVLRAAVIKLCMLSSVEVCCVLEELQEETFFMMSSTYINLLSLLDFALKTKPFHITPFPLPSPPFQGWGLRVVIWTTSLINSRHRVWGLSATDWLYHRFLKQDISNIEIPLWKYNQLYQSKMIVTICRLLTQKTSHTHYFTGDIITSVIYFLNQIKI